MLDSSLLTLNAGFHLNIGDMLAQLIVFIILFALLRKYAWGPIVKMMQDREEHIANEINTAEASREEAERMTNEAKDELKKTRQEAHQIIENAKEAAKSQEQSIIQTARQEAERLKEAAREEIAQERDKAIQALQDQVASLSVRIASKVIEKELSEQDQKALISEYLKEVDGQ